MSVETKYNPTVTSPLGLQRELRLSYNKVFPGLGILKARETCTIFPLTHFHKGQGAGLLILIIRVPSLGQEDSLETGIASHSNILAWRTPWTEETGGLQSMESQVVRHD